MQEITLPNKKRIDSIDIVRGIAMVIMALDHARDFFHISANVDNPLNLATTTPLLFFTRWITHFCAPVFIFLSGTSIYLQSLRKSKTALGIFLIKRGLWLILAEWTIIAIAWTFDPLLHVIPFQVIWTIGISMVILGIFMLLRLPFSVILTLGFIIVLGHNLLDIPESAPGFKAGFWWELFHHGFFAVYEFTPGHFAIIIYPFLAWTGVMMLGYCAGVFFTQKYSPEQRSKLHVKIGFVLLLCFVILRFINIYGDPHPWSTQKTGLLTFLSFINLNKYPPSLIYLCVMIGLAFLLLAFVEKIKNRFTDIMVVFGRTAFLYYILHLYLVHFIAAIIFFVRGQHTVEEAFVSMKKLPFLFVIPGEGMGLAVLYLLWLLIVIILYPICKSYDRYKMKYREKWWLSYL